MSYNERGFPSGDCDRCHRHTGVTIMSKFNRDEICMECQQIESRHPYYKEACRVELENVRSGNMNFAGVGLPADFSEFARNQRPEGKGILTKRDIIEQREQAQEDLLCILDCTDRITDKTLTDVCQVIVNRMNVLIAKLETPSTTCKKCGTPLDENGFCKDITCPYSDRKQDEEFTEG